MAKLLGGTKRTQPERHGHHHVMGLIRSSKPQKGNLKGIDKKLANKGGKGYQKVTENKTKAAKVT